MLLISSIFSSVMVSDSVLSRLTACVINTLGIISSVIVSDAVLSRLTACATNTPVSFRL